MELFKSRTRVAYTNAVGDKVYPVVVDIKKGIKSTEDIQFVSSDVNTGILSVAFISGNENFNVSGADVICSVMRPDASTLELPCEVVRENIVEVPLGINGTSQDGVYSFDFKVLKGGNKIVGTPIMNYSVSLSISNDNAVLEDDRLPVLTMLMTQITTLKNETNSVISTANTAIQNANKATDNTNLAISNAQSATQKAEEVVTRVNNAIASGTQDLEVKEARDGEVSLKARLDRDIEKTNKELDKIKKLEESTVSTVETESDFTTVEATSNGYFEDVKLEGKTIKNLLGSDGRNSVSLNQSLKSKLYTLLEPIPANTDIFIRISVTTKKAPLNGLKLNVMNEDGSYSYFTGFNGVYDQCLKITHGKNITKLGFYMPQGEFDNDSTANITYEKAQVTLVDVGTSYFEGLKSVGQSATTSEDGVDEIVVSSVNGDGNLFDKKNIHLNKFLQTNGDETSVEGWFVSDYIKVADTCYIKGLINVASSNLARICVYTQNKTFKTLLSQPLNTTLNISSFIENGDYIRITEKIEQVDNIVVCKNEISNQIYQSDKKRLLYYNGETQTWEKPILREWDSIEKHADGKYYYHQRSGEVVFNGSENWKKSGYTIEGYSSFYINKPNNFDNNNNYICDKFNVMSSANWSNLASEFTCAGTSDINIRLLSTKLSTQDVEGFKQWLQANNVTVVYQLAQEKVYECTNIDLITYANETNYVVNSGAIVPKTTLKVHNNISNVVKILQEKVSLLENKFIEGLKQVLAGDMYSLAELLYPEDFEEVETENNIMLLPLE